jgi:hypothetical protein
VGRWINVAAQPVSERTPGDKLAEFFGQWGSGPARNAHNFVSLNEHHENFSHMLNQLNSYQNLINPKPGIR